MLKCGLACLLNKMDLPLKLSNLDLPKELFSYFSSELFTFTEFFAQLFVKKVRSNPSVQREESEKSLKK